ncbi:MAG: hypothetical protein ACOC5F_03195 [Candidatus Aminicenantaceae bacterium]
MIGTVLSVPLAAFTVKKFNNNYLKIIAGIATVPLGLVALGKLFLG